MSFLTLASSRGPTVCFRLCTRFALRAAMQTGMTETGASFRELSKWWERQVGKAAPAGQPLPQVSPINALLLFLGDSESSLSPMETNVLDKFPSLTENTLKKKKEENQNIQYRKGIEGNKSDFYPCTLLHWIHFGKPSGELQQILLCALTALSFQNRSWGPQQVSDFERFSWVEWMADSGGKGLFKSTVPACWPHFPP